MDERYTSNTSVRYRFHKHKYISTPTVTPEDAAIAAAGRLAEAIKGNLPHNLGESSLEELTHLGTLLG